MASVVRMPVVTWILATVSAVLLLALVGCWLLLRRSRRKLDELRRIAGLGPEGALAEAWQRLDAERAALLQARDQAQTETQRATAELASVRRDLQALRDHIEQRVNERTSALSSTNLALSSEVDERRRAEEALRSAKEAAEAGNRAKSIFLANMSHEIRTPMNGLIGGLELLAAGDLSSTQHDQVELMRQSAEVLLGLLDGILDLSKIEAGRMDLERVPCRLDRVADAVVTLFRPLAEAKGLTLTLRGEGPWQTPITADPLRLRQILGNLVSNAVKFTDSGRIEIMVDVRVEAETVAARLIVSDTGIGIPPERRFAIFEPFTQADEGTTRRYGGTGLGLTIVSRLLALMGGSISVDSRPGEGATFTARLRMRRASVEPSSDVRPVNTGPGPLLDLRVLVVDDNIVNQTVARQLLGLLGCRVTVANDGSEAMTAAAAGDLDLILMDCQMPVMDGYEATRRIRESELTHGSTRLPIVAMTAHALAGDRQRCLAAGMDDYLAKPVRREALESMLGRWAPLVRRDHGDEGRSGTTASPA